MSRLTDVAYWEQNWWTGARSQRLRLYRDFDFEAVRLLRDAGCPPGHQGYRPQGDSAAKPSRVLEIGAGGSRVLPYLGLNFGFRVCGTDFSLSGCRLLRANLALVGTRGWVVCEDLFQSSVKAESFDLVYSSGLIEHFEDTHAVISEHLRLLKPGGQLVLIVPNLLGLQGKVIAKLAPPLWRVHRVLGADDLAGVLTSLGLEKIRSGYLGSFFIHVGNSPEWSALSDWPRWLRLGLHGSVRAANALLAFLFRLSPLRPHSRAFSPACFATGTKPRP
jgi:2-polyprenyl-6-hydroxyphenyl methylase/3-demethylubiquinone-9 3-methyltransferase